MNRAYRNLEILLSKTFKVEDSTLRDIVLFSIIYTAVMVVISVPLFGWWGAAQFIVMAAVMLLNFRWLKEIVDVITSRAAGEKVGHPADVLKFVFRYLLIGIALYAIITLQRPDALPLLLGLSNMVAGVFGAAIKETFRRK